MWESSRLLALMGLGLWGALSACGGDKPAPGKAGGGSAGTGGSSSNAGAGTHAGATTAGGAGAGAGSDAGSGGESLGGGGEGGAGETGCQILKDGETGARGLTRVYETPNLGSAIFPVGLEGDKVYFQNDGKLWAYPVAGGTASEVGALYADHRIVKGTTLYAVSALDTDPTRHIFSAPLSDLTATATLAEGIDNPFYFIADDTHFYYDHRSEYSIFQVPIGGGTPSTLVPGARPAGLLSRGGYLYWVDFGGYLERVPASGGPREELVPSSDGGAMVADASSLYWINTTAGSIERYDTGATESQRLFESDDFFAWPEQLALAGDTLFSLLGPECGQVLQLKTDGTEEVVLTRGIRGAKWLGVTDAALFIVGDDGLYRADR